MTLKKINDNFIDITKISYIGPIDKHVKYGITTNSVVCFFLLVVDGHPIEIKDIDHDKLKKIKEKLVDDLSNIPGFLPG